VLSAIEAEAAFDAPLAKKDIQAIWLEIDNRNEGPLAISLISVDEDYFAPAEAAQMSHRVGERRSDEKARFFCEQRIPVIGILHDRPRFRSGFHADTAQ